LCYFSSRRRHTRSKRDWSSDVCSSDLCPRKATVRSGKQTRAFFVVDIKCEVSARLFSAADRCFPRARLQPPRETHSAGSSDTCSIGGASCGVLAKTVLPGMVLDRDEHR